VLQKDQSCNKKLLKKTYSIFFLILSGFLFDIISLIGIFTLLLLIFILCQIKINDHILNDFQKIEIIITKLLPKIKVIKKLNV